MRYIISDSAVFPLIEVTLQRGEQIRIESGAMVYHNGDVHLEGKMNSNGGGGLGGVVKALARSAVSGESFFITTATGTADNAKIALAPGTPGAVRELQLGAMQWRVNDGAFLACDAGVTYNMVRQNLGKAIFGGTGGLFVMETAGAGSMLVNAYGDIMEINLDGSRPLVVDNTHVIAWTSTLQYNIKVASGMFGFTSGEGLVNEFYGAGTLLIQTRNVKSLADMVKPYLPAGK